MFCMPVVVSVSPMPHNCLMFDVINGSECSLKFLRREKEGGWMGYMVTRLKHNSLHSYM